MMTRLAENWRRWPVQQRALALVGVASLVLVGYLLVSDGLDKFITFTVLGLATGSIYAIAASGLVVTYTTSGIFNFGHGAIGMVMAFVFWELAVNVGLPTWLAFIIVVFVVAPLFGAIIERVLIRRMENADITSTIVVTVAILVLLLGFAQVQWPPTDARTVSEFFPGSTVQLGGVFVSGHQITTLVFALLAAAALFFVLNRTRIGVAMQAVVDDRTLAALNGAPPGQVSMLAWAIGGSFAALAGVLLAPLVNLEILLLTLLVVNAFAAAIVGRLASLPLTFIGAFVLGLIVEFYKGYQPTASGNLGEVVQFLGPTLPIIFLFLALLFLPRDRLEGGRIAGPASPRIPSLKLSVGAGIALVVAVSVASGFFSRGDLARYGDGLALALVMLSLVPLVGYAGQLSLAPLTFAGIGAFAWAKFGDGGNPMGILAAIVLAALVGAIVALPALRLQGLYLALTTLAFAVAMDNLFFPRSFGFGLDGSLPVDRLSLFGLQFGSERAYVILLAVAFAAVGVLVLVIRRGPLGRRLGAMRDSPQACAHLGLSLTRTKLQVFAISAAIAGLGGALLAGLRGTAGEVDYRLEQSLIIVLLAVIGSVVMVSGPLLAGFLYSFADVVWPEGLGVLIGVGALLLARNPNGVAFVLSNNFGRRLREILPPRLGGDPPDSPQPPTRAGPPPGAEDDRTDELLRAPA